MVPFSTESLPNPASYRKVPHQNQVHNRNTSGAKRAPIMVIPGVCPRCGGVARVEHAAYDTDYIICLYCGWRQEQRRSQPAPRAQLPGRYSREARHDSL